MWKKYNPNPQSARVGDCVIRAISKALNQTWEETYIDLSVEGLRKADLPSANHVWTAYLLQHDYKRYLIPETCPNCYTVKKFCRDYPDGCYILATQSHVVCVDNGDYYDTWDSGDEVPIYYFKRKKGMSHELPVLSES